MKKKSYLYILTNQDQKTLSLGVTNNLIKTIFDHKKMFNNNNLINYNQTKLVYYEVFSDIAQAILREKELKKAPEDKQIQLINKFNPNWDDLYNQIAG